MLRRRRFSPSVTPELSDPGPFVVGALGHTVSRVRRIHYQFEGQRDESVGALELQFDGTTAIVLNAGPDGESLEVAEGDWRDPFEPPLTPENVEFVKTHGKWSAVDVSQLPPYRDLVGSEVLDFHLINNGAEKFVGVEFVIGRQTVRAEVEADDLYVDLS